MIKAYSGYDVEDLRPVEKFSRDLTKTLQTGMGTVGAQALVRQYWAWQVDRTAAQNRIRKAKEAGESTEALEHFMKQYVTLERQAKGALLKYAESHFTGEWMLSIVGVGPVVAAGILAEADLDNKAHVAQLWSFAGFNPHMVWAKGTKRPFNADLKRLCYYAGESFKKTQNKEDDVYGKVYAKAKRYEWERNLSGKFADQAKAKENGVGKTTNAYLWYSGQISPSWAKETLEEKGGISETIPKAAKKRDDAIPMLPPAHLDARARRVVIKLFLSHVFEVHWITTKGTPAPEPFAFEHLGHDKSGYIKPPNFDKSKWLG